MRCGRHALLPAQDLRLLIVLDGRERRYMLSARYHIFAGLPHAVSAGRLPAEWSFYQMPGRCQAGTWVGSGPRGMILNCLLLVIPYGRADSISQPAQVLKRVGT